VIEALLKIWVGHFTHGIRDNYTVESLKADAEFRRLTRKKLAMPSDTNRFPPQNTGKVYTKPLRAMAIKMYGNKPAIRFKKDTRSISSPTSDDCLAGVTCSHDIFKISSLSANLSIENR
jgi:hypothetical protein